MAIGQTSLHVCCRRLTLRAAASQLAATALSAALLVSSGCGHSSNEHPTAKLAGHVTVDGQQIEDGHIQFLPLGKGPGSGQAADGAIAQGSYTADLVPTGKVRVTFAAFRKTGRMINEGGHVFPELVSIIPDKYQQGIDIDVSGDNPNQDFKLVSKGSGADGKERSNR
jgi:hypothetical protein